MLHYGLGKIKMAIKKLKKNRGRKKSEFEEDLIQTWEEEPGIDKMQILNNALELINNGEWKKANVIFTFFCKMFPDDNALQYYRAVTLTELKKFKQAMKILNHIIKNEKNTKLLSGSYATRAEILYERDNEPEKALKDLKKQIKLLENMEMEDVVKTDLEHAYNIKEEIENVIKKKKILKKLKNE